MLKSSLCDYRGTHILLTETITVVGKSADGAAIAAERNNKEVIFRICSLFIDCTS